MKKSVTKLPTRRMPNDSGVDNEKLHKKSAPILKKNTRNSKSITASNDQNYTDNQTTAFERVNDASVIESRNLLDDHSGYLKSNIGKVESSNNNFSGQLSPKLKS